MERVTLAIKSELRDVSLVGVSVNAICCHAGMDKQRADQVELSLVEALTNVIRHGYHRQSQHQISLVVTHLDGVVEFDLYDSGTPMTDSHAKRLVQGADTPDSKQFDLTAVMETGRGLDIIHRTMDRIAYAREGSLNHLHLAKRLQ